MDNQNEPVRNNPDTNGAANVKYKSSVFSLLFSDPKILRELYSAIEGIELPPDIPISINTLSNALTRGKINDLSFSIDNRLVLLAEHQSTINANMPYRFMEYIVEVYKGIIDSKMMFQKNLVKIPKPEFIVLYNGTEKYDDYKELKLSDAFMDIKGLKKEGEPELTLELIVKVYNINHGHNPQILEKSKTLEGYSIFVDKIREFQKEGFGLAESIKLAVEYCRGNNIIKDFLDVHSSEVQSMLYEEYTLEDEIEVIREEERRIRDHQIARNALAEGYRPESVQKITGLDVETIKEIQAELGIKYA